MRAKPKQKLRARRRPSERCSLSHLSLSRREQARVLAGYRNRISELERAVAVLQESSEELEVVRQGRSHYSDLFHQAPAGYIVHDWNGCILDINRAGASLLGLDPSGRGIGTLTQYVTRTDIPAWYEHIGTCALSGQPSAVELNLASGRGAVIPVQLLTTPASVVGGSKPDRFHTLVLDIRGRRATEAALARTQQDYRQFIDTVEGIVWEADADTMQVLYVSQYAERLLGYPVGEWKRPGFWSEHVYMGDRERVANRLAQAIQRHEPVRLDYRVVTASRDLLWLHDSISVAEQDNRLRLLGVAIDVTDQHRAQDLLSAAQSTLELRVAERTAELRQTVGELEAFSYSVSHDLRAPVRSMLGYAELALRAGGDNLPPRVKEYIERIAQGAQRADRLVQDVLSYSRVARANLQLTPIDLDTLVHQIVDQSPQLQPPQAQVRLQDPLLPVVGHEVSLSQTIVNLLSNATKFVAPGTVPTVRIRTEQQAKEVRIWFEDNGIGIEPANLGRIFGIFERVHPAARYEGTGIGLAIVRKSVERMGGTFGVQSEPGKGSQFWIQLKGVMAA